MANTARSTVKAQRSKLARFAADQVYVAAKPGRKFTFRPRSAMLSDFNIGDLRGGVRAGSCAVPSR